MKKDLTLLASILDFVSSALVPLRYEFYLLHVILLIKNSLVTQNTCTSHHRFFMPLIRSSLPSSLCSPYEKNSVVVFYFMKSNVIMK